MTVAIPDQLDMAPLSTANGPLSSEARSLRRRLTGIWMLIDRMQRLSDPQLLEAIPHARLLIKHIAAHGHAEERVIYPYIRPFAGQVGVELAALRTDHIRLDGLARGIAEWTPGQGRAALRGLLEDFVGTAAAHLLVEGEVCMPVVHEHVLSGTEQLLFEAVEIDTFDRSA